MARERAPVEPTVLRWARESIGLGVEAAAKRVSVSPSRLREFETGELRPTVAQLRKMSDVYARPLGVLFLSDPPSAFDAMRDFRRLPGTVKRDWSPGLHRVFRRAEDQQDIASELLEDEGETDVHLPRTGLLVSPEEAAGRVRAWLNVPLREQFRWRNEADALNGWLSAVEDRGVLVLQTSDVDLDEMRGFSISGFPPVVVINGMDSPRGRTFTLAHELGHLTLQEAGLCDMHDVDVAPEVDPEVWCNAFAAALLMPRGAFLAEPSVVSAPRAWEWSDNELRALSRKYGTSREAVLRRLVTIGKADLDYYLARRAAWHEEYEAFRAERRRTSGGGPGPAVMAVRDRGRPFVRLALDAYARRAITASTLSDYLGVRLKHLQKITERVRASS